VLLWNELRARKMKGYQFMRQKPVDEYIVDFYCNKLKLVIEIDGDSHYGKIERDEIKQQKLEAMGLYVLRFDDTEVKKDIYNVLFCIEGWIDEFEKQPLPPLC
jgi:very-short-patch-repair endonuclease